MPTLNQLIKKKRRDKAVKNKVPALTHCPQRKGGLKVYTTSLKNLSFEKGGKGSFNERIRGDSLSIPGIGHNFRSILP